MPPRGQTYIDAKKLPPAPDNPAPDITGLLMRAGPTCGDDPLSAQELQAWCAGAGVRLTAWEFETVLQLSHAYVVQRQKSAAPDCPAPWQPPTEAAEKPKIAKRIRSLLRA